MPRLRTEAANCIKPKAISLWFCLGAVLDVGVGPIVTAGKFRVPLALFVFVFDRLGSPRCALLGGGAPRRVECLCVRGEAFREGAVDGIGPTVFVANDFVGNVDHDWLFASLSAVTYRMRPVIAK